MRRGQALIIVYNRTKISVDNSEEWVLKQAKRTHICYIQDINASTTKMLLLTSLYQVEDAIMLVKIDISNIFEHEEQ